MNPLRRWRHIPKLSLVMTVLLIGPSLAMAQETSATVGPETRESVVRELSDVLLREYVLDDIGAQMAAHLSRRLAEGAYTEMGNVVDFARALTDDLHEVYLDRHLSVLSPESYQAFSRMVEGDHGSHGEMMMRPEIASRVMNRDGRTAVGYLKLPMFDGSTVGLAAIDDVMRSLEGVDAMIIDLRGNPGGDADAVKALSSYLFADSVHLVSSIGPRDESGQRREFERWTSPNEMSPGFADIPVYLLIDDGTFSAAESFAFGLQRTSRAVLVGVPTGGGGHMNAPFDLGGGFGASISVGRTFDPRTGEGWQSTGVVPEIEVESGHALANALSLIAEESARRAGLDPRSAAVRATLLEYADAWYRDNRDRMGKVLDPTYSAARATGGATFTQFDAAELLSSTAQGEGLKTPREYNIPKGPRNNRSERAA